MEGDSSANKASEAITLEVKNALPVNSAVLGRTANAPTMKAEDPECNAIPPGLKTTPADRACNTCAKS